MDFGTFAGAVDGLCLLSFAAVGLWTAHRIDTAARRARKD